MTREDVLKIASIIRDSHIVAPRKEDQSALNTAAYIASRLIWEVFGAKDFSFTLDQTIEFIEACGLATNKKAITHGDH